MRTYEEAKRLFEKKSKKRPVNPHMSPEYSNIVKSISTCFKEKVEDEWYFNGEHHNFWEMLYVTKGHIYVQTNEKALKIEEGNLVFFEPMVFHRMWCNDCPSAKFTVISFYANNNEVLKPLVETVITLDNERKHELHQIYDFICESFDVNLDVYPRPQEQRNTIAERLCYNRLEHFLLSLLNIKILYKQAHSHIGNMNYKHIVDTMVENINKNLSIEDLASLCNMSTSNLKKTFSKYGTCGVMKYFNQLKINRAILFLKDGHSVSNIANNMGFSSPNYFSIVFKRETGMLPSEYKKKKL